MPSAIDEVSVNLTPRPNPNKHFGGGKKYKDITMMSFTETVKAFDARIKDWFLNPANPQVQENQTSIPNGFQVTQACCIAIDLLVQYTNDLAASHKKEYIAFLKNMDSLFAEPISPPIKSWTWYFDKSGNQKTKIEQIETLAQGFYHGFRCGIVHGAMIRDYGRISGIEAAPKIIQLRQWGQNPNEVEIAVNPTLLFQLVSNTFNRYIADLLDEKNQELRRKFANKFYKDFGITLIPEVVSH